MNSELQLPPLLHGLIEAGLWPLTAAEADRQNLGNLVNLELVRQIDPHAPTIYFFPPPFQTAAASAAGNPEFWAQYGALDEIQPDQCLEIGDFGLGSDSPILLDYSRSRTNPRVIFLKWRTDARRTGWKEVARDFEEFADLLHLASVDWAAVRAKLATRSE